MRRFAKNRWWAFILMLVVLLASSTTFPSRSMGEGNDPIVIPGGGDPPSGDPDYPSGSKRTGYGRATPGTTRYTAASVGDGSSARSVWVWRLHLVLRSLIVRYSR